MDKLEQIVAETVRSQLQNPENVERIIRILREQSSVIQSEGVVRLKAMVEQDRDISRKLSNAADAVLDGRGGKTLLAKMEELENQKAQLAVKMANLKKSVDATTIPEQTLRGIVAQMSAGEIDSTDIYLSVVYRVEVTRDEIVIWTILNTSPDGTYDFDAEGVIITPGTASGVPRVNNPNLISVGEGFGLFLLLGVFEKCDEVSSV